MRIGFVLASLMLLFSTVGTVFAAPALVVEQLEHDFGEVIQGNRVEYSFRFQNASDQALEVSRLRSSCGCTAALLSTQRLSPGMLGELKVTFDSQGFRGQIQKMVTFETNDPKHPAVTFSLRGRVKAELYLNPERVNWGRVPRETPLSAVVEIVNDSAAMIILQQPEVTSSDIQAELSSRNLPAGQKVKLKITGKLSEKQKHLAGYVILRSNFSSDLQLKLPVSARLSAN